MIFKMREASGTKQDLYLLVEGDANGLFIGVYENPHNAKHADKGLGLAVISDEDLKKCQEERYPLNQDNSESRMVKF